jgi:hypothetical protein
MHSNAKRRIPSVLVSVASILLTLILLELALRTVHFIHHRGEKSVVFYGPEPQSRLFHRVSSIPGLDYEMAPNRQLDLVGVPVATNQYGMRDSEPSSQTTESPCRIAAIGDSYTFGFGVRAEQAYPKVLEKQLRNSSVARGCQFEVLNFGVIGYSSYDEDLMLKYRVVNFDPRVVIIGYVLNDPEIDPVQPIHAYFAKPAWWQSFRLLSLSSAWITQIRNDRDRKRLGGGDYYIYLHAPGQRKWQSVIDAFGDIHDVTSRKNIKVLLVIFPELPESFKGKPWTDYPYTKIHQQVSDLAIKNGFRVVDLLDSFSRYPSRDVVLTGNDDHPSVLGHEIAATAIEKELVTESSYFFDVKPEQLAHVAR